MQRRPPVLRTVLNTIGAALFAFFAWLQHEDDNPDIYAEPSRIDIFLWVAFYGLVACLFAAAALRRFPRWPFLLVASLGTYHLATTVPGFLDNLRAGGGFEVAKESMSPDRAEVELSREFFGSLIALAAAALVWIQRPGEEESEEKPAAGS